MESHKLTIHEIKDLIDNGKLSIEELVKGVIQRIGKTEAQIKAFNTLETEKIVEEARAIDHFISEGKPLSNLAGIPLGVQDNISTLGIRTSCSSRIIETFIPPYDASVIGRLKEHHAIILGKLNMDEFGIGASTETSAFGPTRNPWNLHRVAGGAAGGAAAAVAADQAFYALASDAAGCLRQPAAFCGVVGLKPTYGLVSRYGLIASAPSLEQIGCITKDVTDCAYVLEEIAFHDKKDPTSPKACRSKYTKGIIDDIRGLKIGIPKEIFDESWDPDVRDSINVALDMFKQLGADLVDITLPHSKYAAAAHFILMTCEASSNLARYDGIKYGTRIGDGHSLESLYIKTRSLGFGQEVKRRVMLGNLFLNAKYYDSYYKKALKVKSLLRKDFNEAYKKCHIILTPTTPISAYNFTSEIDQAMETNQSQRYTLLANMAGIPAITIPCGLSNDGLPIGLQLMADLFNEKTLIRTAFTFEHNTDYHLKKPMQLEVAQNEL